MNKKIYIVTSGEYSDYGIDAVFSSKELAKKYIKFKSRVSSAYYDCAHIEEYILDELPKYPPNKNHYIVILQLMTGYLVDIYLTNTNSDKDLCYEVIKTSTGVKNLQVYCWAKDEEHAKRIAYDTRTKILAEGAIP